MFLCIDYGNAERGRTHVLRRMRERVLQNSAAAHTAAVLLDHSLRVLNANVVVSPNSLGHEFGRLQGGIAAWQDGQMGLARLVRRRCRRQWARGGHFTRAGAALDGEVDCGLRQAARR